MSREFAKFLTDKRNAVREEQKKLLDTAIAEKRELSAEEQQTFDRQEADIVSLGNSARQMVEAEAEQRSAEEAFAKLGGVGSEGTDQAKKDRDELRAFLRGETSERSFALPEMRADQTTTTAAGAVKTGVSSQLWEYMIETSSVLQLNPQILRTATGETIKLPRATAHSAAGAITEGSTISASDPTISSVNSTVTKRGFLTQFSQELLTDSAVDLEGYIARQAGVALGNDVGIAAVTAAIAAASAGVTAGNGIGAVTSYGQQSDAGEGFDFLIDLFYSVIAPYRNSPSCGWLLSDPGAAAVRKLKSSEGVYAWQAATVAGQPDMILGKPVYTDTNVADPAASAKSILFGDWSSLVVRLAGGFRIERSDEFAFDADLTTFRVIARHGTVSVDANALKSFVHAAS
jgi:HK97 family phage major capsid protein